MPVISNTDLAYEYVKEFMRHPLNVSIFHYLVYFAAIFYHSLSTVSVRLCKSWLFRQRL